MKKPELHSDTLSIITATSLRVAKSGEEILAELRDGAISTAEAAEMNNTLGKITGANGTAIKAELLQLALTKHITNGMKTIETDENY